LSDPWLVVGLGNPGERYADTRHNAGAMVVERLCNKLGARLRKVRMVSVFVAEARHGDAPLLLCVPASLMNECGPPIASFARKRGVPVERVIACHDEIDLGFGALRIKHGGSTAGHHGLDSMVAALGSGSFYRIRLGVGRPAGRPQNVDFLLKPFRKDERDEVALLVDDAADAALSLIAEGLRRTQDRFNRGAVSQGPPRV
jgi:PTH1 family peptidyl-tRNA hydrolase